MSSESRGERRKIRGRNQRWCINTMLRKHPGQHVLVGVSMEGTGGFLNFAISRFFFEWPTSVTELGASREDTS
jgi:hypothetical protein